MKQIKKTNVLEQKLDEAPITPQKVFTMKDVLTTKDDSKPRKDTSVRVFQDTRVKLNLLIQFLDIENVDILINKMIDDFVPEALPRETKKLYNMMLEIELNKLK